MDRRRLNPARKKTFYDGSKELFFRAKSAEQRHLAEAGFDGDFASCGSF
jgi:hypothetical protein